LIKRKGTTDSTSVVPKPDLKIIPGYSSLLHERENTYTIRAMNTIKNGRLQPFIMTIFILIADQLSKFLISTHIGEREVACSLFNGFLTIIHERNTGIALSIGAELPYFIRFIIFAFIPLVVLGYAVFYALKTSRMSTLQRYAVAGIVGGGLGNIIDRIFRVNGVVDFISFRLYGIFGLSHFPTFNVADSFLTISAALFVLSLFFQPTGNMGAVK
jgi:signal peptidase II